MPTEAASWLGELGVGCDFASFCNIPNSQTSLYQGLLDSQMRRWPPLTEEVREINDTRVPRFKFCSLPP